MRILSIDTSTDCGSIAILEDETLRALLSLNIKKTHSQRLLPCMDFLLSECGLKVNDMDAFAVARGPGSFTGVRIALACAKGLAFASGKPLVGVSTLEALARQSAEPDILLCPILDARRGEIFGAAYREEHIGGRLCEVLPGRAEPLDKFLENISEPALFSGDGAIKFADAIKKKLGGNAHFAPPGRNLPSAVTVALLGRERLLRGESDDVETLVPIYLRQHDARLPLPSH